MKVGSGKSSGTNRFKRKDFKLKDGDQIYRIMPGLGDLADSNRWSVHYSVHWGYKTTDGRHRPFASPEQRNRETKAIEVVDAAKERIEVLKAKLEEAKKSGNKAAVDKLNELIGSKGLYNLDSNHHLNVIDLQGNIGVLKIRHKCKVALDAQIKKLESGGIYPLSPTDGRFFVLTRTGMGNETSFAVSVLQEELDVPGVGKVKRDVSHSLTDDVINRLANEAGRLDQLFPRPTAEQVQRIVSSSDLMTGVSPYLDELYGKGKAQEDTSDNSAAASSATAPAIAAAQAPVSAKVTHMAKDSVKVAETSNVNPTKVAPAAVDLSHEDFLERLNNGTL